MGLRLLGAVVAGSAWLSGIAALAACSTFSEAPADAAADADADVPSDARPSDVPLVYPDGALSNCSAGGFDLCDDFERTTAAGGVFNWQPSTGEGGSIEILQDPSVGGAPSKRLRSSLPVSAGDPRAFLTHALGASSARIELAFSMRADPGSAEPSKHAVALEFSDGSSVAVDVRFGKIELLEQDASGPAFTTPVGDSIPGRWTRYLWIVDLKAQSTTIARDDGTLASTAFKYAHAQPNAVNVGVSFSAGALATTNIDFDDVALTEAR